MKHDVLSKKLHVRGVMMLKFGIHLEPASEPAHTIFWDPDPEPEPEISKNTLFMKYRLRFGPINR